MQSYADGTQILFHFDLSSTDYVNVNLNSDLRAISDGCAEHKLKLMQKEPSLYCVFMGKKRNLLDLEISIFSTTSL